MAYFWGEHLSEVNDDIIAPHRFTVFKKKISPAS